MSTVTRRIFLQRSLAAAAALSASPYIARGSAPNDTLGVAVVGLRGRGGSLLSAFSSDPRTRVVASSTWTRKCARAARTRWRSGRTG